jgi:hypothetical protein
MRASRLLLPLLLLVLCAGACESTLSVSTIQLGRSLNADQTVANHTTVFAPNDTVYVSVHTTGVGSGTLSVRWSYAGRVVGEPKKELKSRGATEFHLQNAGGFPLGEYSVEVFLDGVSGGTRTFRVEQR